MSKGIVDGLKAELESETQRRGLHTIQLILSKGAV